MQDRNRSALVSLKNLYLGTDPYVFMGLSERVLSLRLENLMLSLFQTLALDVLGDH